MAFTKRGIAPPDLTTSVGKFRVAANDSEWQPYDPDQPGYGLYQIWTDDEIAVLIELSGGSVARAVSLAYAQIGAMWAATGATIKTDDLTYSAKESVGNWMALSKFWGDIADGEAGSSADDMFDLVVVRGEHGFRKPEASPYPAGPWSEFW